MIAPLDAHGLQRLRRIVHGLSRGAIEAMWEPHVHSIVVISAAAGLAITPQARARIGPRLLVLERERGIR